MIREVHETCIPAEFVKARGVTPIPEATRGHERMQHEDSRCSPAARAWKKIGTCGVVSGKICIYRAGPCDCAARPIVDWRRSFNIVWHGVKILGRELLADRHVGLHLVTAARM